MLRQDGGSCHGMRLTGGLAPALTRDGALIGMHDHPDRSKPSDEERPDPRT